MRNRMMIMAVVGIMLLVVGCRVEYSETEKVLAPSWADNGDIIYVKEYTRWKTTYNTFGEDCVMIADTFYLMRCDVQGENKILIRVITSEFGGWTAVSSNSSSDWAIVSFMGGYARMYLMKLDGSDIDTLGAGMYPDLSPDGSKIVYAKRNEGIWIMNRDGSGDHKIVSDTTASYPAWSPDDTLIAYGIDGKVNIFNLKNIQNIKVYDYLYFPNWYTEEKLLVHYSSPNYEGGLLVDIITDKVDTLLHSYIKSSPDTNYFIGYDGLYFIVNIDGTNKWYIEP